nr:alcohol dehydrogenase catalytic domain-containing protein [Streptomyces sp. 846.5]
MRPAEFEPPRPGPDEVLVRVRTAASNALDWKMRNGEMKLMTGRSFPRAMGHDFAGVVEAVGAGVTRLKAGDAVLGRARFRQAGAFAEMVTAVRRKPGQPNRCPCLSRSVQPDQHGVAVTSSGAEEQNESLVVMCGKRQP